jgi:predicted ATPase
MTVTNATIKIGMMKYLAFIMVLLSAEEPDYACMIRIGICN